MPDPFANIAAPSVGGCTATNLNLNNNTTINPGVYCNGIVMSGGSHTLTLNPGTYILAGGGLNMKAGTLITGSGVTIYNTAANGYGYKPVTFAGNTHVDLSAPTSGPMESMLFFTDRSIVNTTNNTLTGDNTSTIIGTIYMPNVPVQFIGNSTLIAYTVLAVRRLSLTGNATINDDYSSLQSGAPISAGAIVAE